MTTITFINRTGKLRTWKIPGGLEGPIGREFRRENREYVIAEDELLVLTKRGHWSRIGRGVEIDEGGAHAAEAQS